MKLPQISLRDLFWLVLVCALVLAHFYVRHREVGRYQIQVDGSNRLLLLDSINGEVWVLNGGLGSGTWIKSIPAVQDE
jgi:hypothetical protein